MMSFTEIAAITCIFPLRISVDDGPRCQQPHCVSSSSSVFYAVWGVNRTPGHSENRYYCSHCLAAYILPKLAEGQIKQQLLQMPTRENNSWLWVELVALLKDRIPR